jgi:hypothetical protein
MENPGLKQLSCCLSVFFFIEIGSEASFSEQSPPNLRPPASAEGWYMELGPIIRSISPGYPQKHYGNWLCLPQKCIYHELTGFHAPVRRRKNWPL